MFGHQYIFGKMVVKIIKEAKARNKMWSFLQSYNGALSVIGTLIVALISFFSLFVSMKTLKEMRETREDENRPYVIVYLNKEPKDVWFELCLKNFGKTAARIEDLILVPELKTCSGKSFGKVFQNTVLMPNQKIHTLFIDNNADAVKKFGNLHMKCKYSVLGRHTKIYEEEYDVNYEYTQEFAYEGERKTNGQSVAENSLQNIAEALDIMRRQR